MFALLLSGLKKRQSSEGSKAEGLVAAISRSGKPQVSVVDGQWTDSGQRGAEKLEAVSLWSRPLPLHAQAHSLFVSTASISSTTHSPACLPACLVPVQEVLRGPFIYVLVLLLATVLYWRENVVGLIAVSQVRHRDIVDILLYIYMDTRTSKSTWIQAPRPRIASLTDCCSRLSS